MPQITITKPTMPDDFPQINEVFYRAWLATYPNAEIGITAEDIEERFKYRKNPEEIAKRVQGLSNMPANQAFFVAKDADNNNRIVGVCRVVIREDCNQLQAIYVLPEYQGRGIGHMFWDAAQGFFDPQKKTIVQVATYNAPAIAFYKKLGFVDNGKRFTEERHRMPISGKLVPEMEMEMEGEGVMGP